jgi:diaminohydroxyphosphoribosylaminopyrimidine deaminase/5-amino-6-(5-phosphoribosylamino)uracil reductase
VPAGAGPDEPGIEGATDGRDGPHAEVVALVAAGPQAAGATLYSTLEPCCHTGRTGPCTDAILAAGVARVVVGVTDPDPLVAGEGLARLRDAGVEVDVGVLADQAAAQLEPYLVHRRTGRPFVVLKLAATLDGATAAPDGTSQWITGDEARLDAHHLRADSDAIVVGAGTVRTDDPALTVRLREGELPADFRPPRRVVLGAAPADARIRPALEWQGDLGGLLDHLGAEGVLQLMVEGGASVAHDFHTAGLVDRYVLYLAPALLGGDDARGLFTGPGASTLAEAWRGRLLDVRRVGTDLRVELAPAAVPATTAPIDPSVVSDRVPSGA